MFNHEKIEKYWIKEFLNKEVMQEIENYYLENFDNIFNEMVKEGYESETQTFIGELSERLEKVVSVEFESRIWDICPNYKIPHKIESKFFDHFVVLALESLFDCLDIKNLCSDLFGELCNEKKDELYEKGIIDFEGDLIKEKNK